MSSDTICIYCHMEIVNRSGDRLGKLHGWYHKRYKDHLGSPSTIDYRKRCQSKIFFWKNHEATPVPTSGLDQYYREVVWKNGARYRYALPPGALDEQVPSVLIYEDDYEPPPFPKLKGTFNTGFPDPPSWTGKGDPLLFKEM